MAIITTLSPMGFSSMSTPINVIIDSKSVIDDMQSCRIQMDDKSFCFTVSIDLMSSKLWDVFDPDTKRGQLRIKVAIGSQTYRFFCEERTSNAGSYGVGFSVWGRSAQAILSRPFCETIQDNDSTIDVHQWRTGAVTASTVINQVLTSYAPTIPSPQITISWNVEDYVLKRDSLVLEGKTIIEVIQMLAGAVGAQLVPSIDGNLSIESYSVIAKTPVESYTDIDDIVVIGEEIKESSGYNKVVVHGYEPGPDDGDAAVASIAAEILTTGDIKDGREVRVKVPYYHSHGAVPICYFPNGSYQLPTSYATEEITETVALMWGKGNYSFPDYNGNQEVTGNANLPFDYKEVTYTVTYREYILLADAVGVCQALFYFADKSTYASVEFTVGSGEEYWDQYIIIEKYSPDNPVGGDTVVIRAYGAFDSGFTFSCSSGVSVVANPGVLVEEDKSEEVVFTDGVASLSYPVRSSSGYPTMEVGGSFPGLNLFDSDIKWAEGSNQLRIEKLVSESAYRDVVANISYRTAYRQYSVGVPASLNTGTVVITGRSGDGDSTTLSITIGAAGIPQDVTIYVRDYISNVVISGAMVYIDGNFEGVTDADGKLQVVGIDVGDHNLKITKAGYVDSDQDEIDNDDFTIEA